MAATHRSKAWRRDANLIIRPINPAGRARLFPLYPASAAEGVGGGLVIESGLYQIMSGAILSLATQRGGPNQRRVGASGQQGLYFHCSLTDGTKSNDGVNSISFSSDFLSLFPRGQEPRQFAGWRRIRISSSSSFAIHTMHARESRFSLVTFRGEESPRTRTTIPEPLPPTRQRSEKADNS